MAGMAWITRALRKPLIRTVEPAKLSRFTRNQLLMEAPSYEVVRWKVIENGSLLMSECRSRVTDRLMI